jgi:uncharacterized membrane protein
MNHASTLSGNTGFFDFRFLNPFTMDTNNNMIGTRYGYGQFIVFFSYITIILLTIKNYKSPYAAATGLLVLSSLWFSTYYSLSCYFIPNNVERCFFGPWIYTILPVLIVSTIILVFILISLFGSMVGGAKTDDKTVLDTAVITAKNVANDVADKVKDYFKGGKKHKTSIKTQKKDTKDTTTDKLMKGAIDYFT